MGAGAFRFLVRDGNRAAPNKPYQGFGYLGGR